MARPKKTRPVPVVAYWEPMQEKVEILSMGHYPDTVIVRYNDKQCEVDVRELMEIKS